MTTMADERKTGIALEDVAEVYVWAQKILEHIEASGAQLDDEAVSLKLALERLKKPLTANGWRLIR